MRRRDFLKTAGSFVASASVGGLWGCGDDDPGRPDASPNAGLDAGSDGGFASGPFRFTEGVASGDPRPSSVMLWTRVSTPDAGAGKIRLMLEVATDEDFSARVLSREIEATSASDHTVRVLVTDLEPDTIYYYRFTAGTDQSRVGRTWTAPAPDADRAISFAWVCCQDYLSGFFGSYRQLLNEDAEKPEAEQLRFLLHVGDFIYETRGEGFQMALDEDLEAVMLVDADGKPRMIDAFPSGGGMLESGATFARDASDYRHLYKSVLHDRDLQDARARWPFVCVWDDHEFSDDYWQTQANYTRESGSDEPSQPRKLAANQAWFEYVPAILSDAEAADGVEPEAHDFEPDEVEVQPYSDEADPDEPNNLAALASLTIYRRLRYGRHVDLLLTDNRSYRSDHAVPEQSTVDNILVFHPRAALPLAAVNSMDAGRDAPGGPPPTAGGIINARTKRAPGSILGSAQKQWWKDSMRASDATFKLWGNSLPLLRILLDTTEAPLFPEDLVLSADGWDGYPSERRELMSYLRDEGILNVISLSGDHHAHFAGLVHDDYDSPDGIPVMVDFATAGVSSTSQFTAIAGQIGAVLGPNPEGILLQVANLIAYDATRLGGEGKAIVNLNNLIRYGSASAVAASQTNDREKIEAARNPEINAHLRYVDCAANGYGLCTVDGETVAVTLVTTEIPLTDRGDAGAETKATATFVVKRVDEGERPELTEPELTGELPFPLG